MNFIPGNICCRGAANSNSERQQLKTGFPDETRFLATGIQLGGEEALRPCHQRQIDKFC